MRVRSFKRKPGSCVIEIRREYRATTPQRHQAIANESNHVCKYRVCIAHGSEASLGLKAQIHLLEIHALKIRRVMTALAVTTEASVMRIVGGVTTETITRQLHFIRRLAMTIGALRFCMSTRERKLRIFVVIE